MVEFNLCDERHQRYLKGYTGCMLNAIIRGDGDPKKFEHFLKFNLNNYDFKRERIQGWKYQTWIRDQIRKRSNILIKQTKENMNDQEE